MMKFLKLFFPVLLFLVAFQASANNLKALGEIPVQDLGRVKPFESFARESLQLVYGKQKYNGKGASEIVFTWMFLADFWDEQKIVKIDNKGLKESLKLDPGVKYFSPKDIATNERLPNLIADLQGRRERKENLDAFYQAVQTLNNQITLYFSIRNRLSVRVMPKSMEAKKESWIPVAELPEDILNQLAALVKSIGAVVSGRSDKIDSIDEPVAAFITRIEKEVGGVYYPAGQIKAELILHRLAPFMWSWIFYLLAAIGFTVFIINEKKLYLRAAWGSVGIALILHTAGFLLRTYIVERAPVTNMYETVVWAPWGTVFFAIILEYVYKKRFLILSACIVSVLCLIMADLAPTVLDPSLQPLEPVLRDNFWLLTHVLIIVMSYGAFFLAWALGNIVMTLCLIDEGRFKQKIKEGSLGIYRSNQIGILLLGIGIVLGGIWADYSWGRFWGWDPKETWALIALLGYLAVVHAKYVGLIKDFGMAATSVVAFSLVIMAWYGVNYVLGAGLHSYGFGAGGVEYVASIIFVQILYVVFVAKVRHSRSKQS